MVGLVWVVAGLSDFGLMVDGLGLYLWSSVVLLLPDVCLGAMLDDLAGLICFDLVFALVLRFLVWMLGLCLFACF